MRNKNKNQNNNNEFLKNQQNYNSNLEFASDFEECCNESDKQNREYPNIECSEEFYENKKR